MKINKSILALALGLGSLSLANAGTVYLSGSTALRGSVYTAIRTAGVVFTAVPSTTLYDGGSAGNNAGSGANYMAFQGTLVGGSGTTTLLCHWSGSEEGIKDVAVPATSETFIDPSTLDGADHGTNQPTTVSHSAIELCFADNAQSFSKTKTPVVTGNSKIGVITFKWVRNPGLWTGTNITFAQIRAALDGFCKRAVFSGSLSDTNDYVYVSGRSSLSGTRVNAFGTSGYGIGTLPNQIEINSGGVMQDLDGAGTYAGDFGYSSGGTLAKTLGANTTASSDLWNGATGFSVVSYLSVGDAATAIGLGAVELTVNGVPFSAANVKEGTYDFWGNAYVFKANAVVNGSEADTVYGKLVVGVPPTFNGVNAIKLTDMHCTRTGPTSDPAHN